MWEVIGWSAHALLLAVIGVTLLETGYRRRRFPVIIPGVLCLMVATVCAGVVVSEAVQRAVHHAHSDVAPR
jgi:hypothetical protein